MRELTGKTILHYRILQQIGQGGMGVVYKAEDTKLERTVALKFLSLTSIGDEEKKRFKREAKAAASLNHPNIATIFAIDEVNGQLFIAMEFIEGNSLHEIIHTPLSPPSRGESKGGVSEGRPLPLDKAIDYATQTAAGLQAAHEKGVTHRDIKSANIMVTDTGQVKIMDFGLAKLTNRSKLTQLGSTLGTTAYMSPEQAQGVELDHRSDIWSLGVVLYEMLSGQMPFKGDYEQVVIYSIQTEDPEPLTALRSGVPIALDGIIAKMLAKDPDTRYQHVDELPADLKAIDTASVSRSRISTAAQSPAVLKQKSLINNLTQPILLAASFLFVAILAAIISWSLHPQPIKEVRKYQWPLEYDWFVLSPDGKKIAYSQNEKLWIRKLGKLNPVEIENDKMVSNIIWSPNSESIAYFTGTGNRERQLKKVSIDGSGSVLITKTGTNYYPRFWGADDSILVNTWDNKTWDTLLKVPASGGSLKAISGGDSTLAMISGNLTHVLELPAGKAILLSRIDYGRNVAEIFLQKDQERTLLYQSPPESFIERPVFANSGHILYPRFDFIGDRIADIWAIPFDLSSLQITGKQFLVAKDANRPSVSENGLLLYMQQSNVNAKEQLVLLSRDGKILKNISQPQLAIHSPEVSPDGRMIATASLNEQGMQGIWLHDIANGTKSQLSFELWQTWKPSWSLDGKQIVFQHGISERTDIYIQATDSRSESKPLLHSKDIESGPHWSADGRYILYSSVESEHQSETNIWFIESSGDHAPKRLFQSRFEETLPCMSPDGRYVAYVSDKSGRREIYVTSFPDADRERQVSFAGGSYPQWIGDEIFFVNYTRNSLMSVAVKTRPEFQAGNPQKLFSAEEANVLLITGNSFKYTVLSNSKNIIAVKKLGEAAQPNLVLVENWFEEFRDKN